MGCDVFPPPDLQNSSIRKDPNLFLHPVFQEQVEWEIPAENPRTPPGNIPRGW